MWQPHSSSSCQLRTRVSSVQEGEQYLRRRLVRFSSIILRDTILPATRLDSMDSIHMDTAKKTSSPSLKISQSHLVHSHYIHPLCVPKFIEGAYQWGKEIRSYVQERDRYRSIFRLEGDHTSVKRQPELHQSVKADEQTFVLWTGQSSEE
jgi:hypothetical protein